MNETEGSGGRVYVQRSWDSPRLRPDAQHYGGAQTAREALPSPRKIDDPRDLRRSTVGGRAIETPIQWRRNMIELRGSSAAGFPAVNGLEGERASGLSSMRRVSHRHAKEGQKKHAMPVVPVRPFTVETHDHRQRGQRQSLGMGKGLSRELEAMRSSSAPAPPPSSRGLSRASSKRSVTAGRASDPQGLRETPPVPASRRSRVVKHQYGIQMPIAEDRGGQDNDEKEQNMELEEKLQRDLDLEDDDMTVKLINLPAVMCHASNGEVFMVDTRTIQNKRIRRVLGVKDQQKASKTIECITATPKNIGNGTHMDGNMDVGLLPDESDMLNLKVPGEDGNWEAVDLNQDFYEEYRSQAPEYVNMQIAHFARSKIQGRTVDFDHWLMLRELDKQKGRAVRKPEMMRGTSWAPKKFMESNDSDFSSEESTPRLPHQSALRSKDEGSQQRPAKGVAFGTSVPGMSSPKRLGNVVRRSDGVEDLQTVSVDFEFDGEKMKLQKKAVPQGVVLPQRTKSTVHLRKMFRDSIKKTNSNGVEEEQPLEEEQPEKEEVQEDHELRDLVKQISVASAVAGDFRQQELAKKQYSRMHNWAMAQQHKTGGGARRRPSNSRAAESPSPEKARSPSPTNRGKKVMSKMHNKMLEQHKNHAVMALASNDPLSLVNGARTQSKNRESIKGRWDKRQMSSRSKVVPIEPPEELPDEEIQKRHAAEQAQALQDNTVKKTKKKAKAADDSDESSEDEEELERRMMEEHEQRIRERLRQFEEAEKNVAEHPDYVFSGAEGKPSIKEDRLMKVYDAAFESNQFAYDETEAKEQEEVYRKKAESSRMFQSRMLAKPNNATMQQKFKFSIDELHSARPYFRAPDPTLLKRTFERRPWTLDNDKVVKPTWSIEKSIFRRRKGESDAKDYYDNEKLLGAQAEIDWHRVTAKKRFVKFVRFVDSEVADGEQAIQGELEEVHDVIISNYMAIRSAFYYFCCKGTTIGEAAFSMRVNAWLCFCKEVGVTDPRSAVCNSGSLQSMFVAVNHEDADAMTAQEQDENDDNALMRFEWIEGIVRLAVAKFAQDKNITEDVSDAVNLLCQYHLSTMPPEATLNTNIFRRERLYNEGMDICLQSNINFLEAVFNAYKAKNSSKYFWMEHWFALLDALDVFKTDKLKIGYIQAKLIFMWSKMGAIDELRRRQRVVSWQFLDFLEGLGRLADALGLPSNKKLDEIEAEPRNRIKFQHTGHLRQWEYVQQSSPSVWANNLDPCFGLVRQAHQPPESRPLVDKFEAFIGFMIGGLCEKWDVEIGNVERLNSKLKAMAVMLGGGIELG